MAGRKSGPGPNSLWDTGDVLREELTLVKARRDYVDGTTTTGPATPNNARRRNRETDAKLKVYNRAVDKLTKPLSALTLSGGGIRSAAFALGVMQGLAKRKLLQEFDYVSTVSGGGYAGAFLTAWVHRAGYDAVQKCLEGKRPTDPNSALHHLRRYSNYLSPRSGLFSADRLTMVVIYLRNLLLNWLVILPVIVLAVVLMKLFAAMAWGTSTDWRAMLAIVAVTFIGISFVDSVRQRPGPHGETAESTLLSFYIFEILPMLVGAVVATVAAIGFLRTSSDITWWASGHLALVGALTGLMTCLIAMYFSALAKSKDDTDEATVARQIGTMCAMVVSWAIGAALIGAAIYGASQISRLPGTLTRDHLLIVLGPPTFILAMFLGEVIYVALTHGSKWGEAEREWLARAAGHHVLAAAGWLIMSGLVIIGPLIVIDWVNASLATPNAKAKAADASATIATVAGTGGLAGAVTAFLGWMKKTAGTVKEQAASWKEVPLNILMALFTTIFVICLVVVLSSAVDWMLFDETLTPLGEAHRIRKLALLGAIILSVGGLSSYFVSINHFSMHGVYRNRLIRTFLGASHNGRNPNDLTDFDSTDNLDLCAVWPGNPTASRRRIKRRWIRKLPLQRPLLKKLLLKSKPPAKKHEPAAPGRPPSLLVMNMSLNAVGSTQLAWQERKAISFTATPRWIGVGELPWSYRDKLTYDRPTNKHVGPNPGNMAQTAFNGFFRSAEVYGKQMSLGTAMTISGAAVSPNMGYSSSPAYSILMTLFNVRLGAWYGNPGPSGEAIYTQAGPVISAAPLISEALGITTTDRRYVYLSDGGHFENLGIYEMVRRRCRLIVVSDAGEDGKMTFEDLGNAVRRIELDFGVRIRFKTFSISGKVADAAATFALGEIAYPDSTIPGALLYVKPCRDDNAPFSVRSYAALNDKFPHESTTDQFFGESQFEAYRALGEHAIGSIVPTYAGGDVGKFLAAIQVETARKARVPRIARRPECRSA